VLAEQRDDRDAGFTSVYFNAAGHRQTVAVAVVVAVPQAIPSPVAL
jgi:hypothetical protein